MTYVDLTGKTTSEPSLGELVGQASKDISTLVRKEVELAKAELSAELAKAGKGAGMFGGAGLMGLLAAGALTTCIIAALDTAMPLWLAALIVAVVYGAIAGVLALQGRDRVKRATPPVPEQTIDSTKEDVAWAKTRARSGSR
jgi:uncharacterized membrane protein YqjE